jgi:hypothetical protein
VSKFKISLNIKISAPLVATQICGVAECGCTYWRLLLGVFVGVGSSTNKDTRYYKYILHRWLPKPLKHSGNYTNHLL